MKSLVLKLKIEVKNYKFLLLLAVSLLTFLSFSSNYALAVGDAYFPQDTIINLTIDNSSTNFTVLGESEANQVTVDTSSITVNISPGQTFKFRSYGGNKLTNDANVVYSCSGGESQLNLTVSTIKDVVISPDASNCSPGGGGGGGGGGGTGGTTSTSTATPTPIDRKSVV